MPSPTRPPTPARLIDRLRSLALIERLCFPEALATHGSHRFILRADGRLDGGYNCYSPEGGYFWLFAADDAALYCGASQNNRWRSRGPEIERNARDAIGALPPRLRTLVHKYDARSYGWTFAVWSATENGPWIDLTGEDPDCRMVHFKGCREFYSAANKRLAAYTASQWGIHDGAPAVLDILKHRPLTPENARAINPELSFEVATKIANEIGYPVST